MIKLFYELFTGLYPLAIQLISPFNPKAKSWIEGRKDVFKQLEKVINPADPITWMHCSSLGEFEQGRPVLERIKATYTNTNQKILLTFFSPSGYEATRNYKGADYIFYLPMDSAGNAVRFFNIVKPELALFVKYDFWFHYLTEAKKRNIPLLLISGIFRKDQPFFKWYGSLHKEMLTCFSHLFVQNAASANLLASINITNVTIGGDTRFDRVIEIAEKFEPLHAIEEFCNGYPVIVAGSTWSEDDKELDHFVNTHPEIRFIIAPHNIGKHRIDECRMLYKHSVLFSQLNNNPENANVNTLVIDNIGMLSRLYKYATIAYVGGAFGEDGVHNVLEPAVYGKPVVFGPEYEKYIEAIELIECGGAVSIENALELEKALHNFLEKKDEYQQAANAAGDYVYSRKGPTDMIVDYVVINRLLTS